eukprot:TRINITY_DN1615_c0_g1_i5.p1 TRINITY_DN1615_c0_g1~~TRINITY_DN1615_c0_g1_i5.p1  ORF type:complete len:109 (+),score=18.09 TRINITY_DN1615_c0_g1_i5:168-494(+)
MDLQVLGLISISPRMRLQTKITQALNPVSLNIVDESHKHAGHVAMQGKHAAESHFNLEIVSQAFEGKSLLARHRMIHDLLADELKTSIHALSLKTKTPTEINKAVSST